RENIYLNGAVLGMRRGEIDRHFDAIVDFAGVEKFLDTPVKHYSSGMYVRLAFAVAAHLNPEILIIDEVLAVGDMEFQRKCLGKMGEVARSGRTVLFVSHNMGAVSSLCNRAVLMADGRVDSLPLMPGEYSLTVRLWQPGELLDEVENVASLPVEWLGRQIGQFNWNSSHGAVYVEASWRQVETQPVPVFRGDPALVRHG